MNNYKTEALSEGIILTGKKSKHRYEIIQYLGRGGFGITYLAKETVTIDGIPQTHKYTIKEFCLSDICAREADGSISVSNDHLEEFKESKAEFLKEAEHLKELSHAGIVPVSEVFTMNNTVYYVMQYLGDTTLLKFIQQQGGTLDEDTALDITRKVAASLGYLHEHMMTHLDVKPDNIMMFKGDGESLQPVLIDFGLSCHYNHNGKITAKMVAVGTSAGYSPMEQYVPGGVKTFTPQADIYALGATLFHMLSGQAPSISTDVSTKYIYKHLPDGITDRTSNAIVIAMQKNVEDRPKSISEFLHILNCKNQNGNNIEGGVVTEPGTTKITLNTKKRIYLYTTLAIIVAIVLVFILSRNKPLSISDSSNNGEIIEQTDSVNNDEQPVEEDLATNGVGEKPETGHNNLSNEQVNNNNNATSHTSTQTDANTPTKPEPVVISKEKDLGYAVWYGSTVNGKPDGDGKIVFKQRHIIDSFDPEKQEAEIDDYVIGYYENGHLVSGKLFDSHGNQKKSIYIGGL